MNGLYHPGDSLIHRLPAGAKLVALAAAGTLMVLTAAPAVIGGFLVAVLALYAAAQAPARLIWAQIRPLIWVLAILFAAQWVFVGPLPAVVIVTRLAGLVLLAGLVTLTTRSSAMIETITRALSPLARFGLRPARISLTLSLALRFIPVMAQITDEVRQAQRARGLDRSIIALTVPVIVRMLKMADDIAQAIDARGFDSPATPFPTKGQDE
ncbi:energy-coupling factor transporter transmembrane protein EcfT [Paracoccus sp. p3-h83]|uniref:energy-coupling factor transporter transmembrane component T family protein n=1 Tax=Paracoccus sp. p3-h83 TaxID=3342805 RepID=UPI0035BA4616